MFHSRAPAVLPRVHRGVSGHSQLPLVFAVPAQCSNLLDSVFFNTARDVLREHFKYPEGLGKSDCVPGFAILHCDVQKNLLMKIDAPHYVQWGMAYRELKPVPDTKVIELYSGTQNIPLYQVSDFYGKSLSLKQFMDIFSHPEMALLFSVIDYFITHGIDFDQKHLYKDIFDAVRDVHVKGVMCKWIEKDLEQPILQGEEIYAVLNQLVNRKKKIFPITVERKMAYYLLISTRISCFAHLFALVSLQAAFSFALFNWISTKVCSIEFPACPFSVRPVCRYMA
ncbi:hypothetical protein AV530_011952 [Patagioenas fasciata monilis]|uniref:Uncharacterized protein n=1 Tax=Patagioenas fasciata monilis TaxID=372326 RepID=A0A1V4JUA8_PATFA|nr:hypothetical protein AV530_011952 [Patagioenas fasciata monilis]